jgi:outer membrane protein assembly factor BamD
LNRKITLISATLLAAMILLLAGGCAKRAHRMSQDGVTVDWAHAMELFEHERYYRAQQLFQDIALNYSGSAVIDSAYFYLGRCSYELNDYLVAADEFHRVITRFPSSTLAGDASFYEALSYFQLAPCYALDQQFMTKSFETFQRFLEDYSGHALSDSAYAYMAEARERLALKAYRAAELYYQLGEYASAILYAKAVLADYYDTSQAEQAQFLIGKSYQRLKDWKRTYEEYENYLSRFPDGSQFERASELAQMALKRRSEMPDVEETQ